MKQHRTKIKNALSKSVPEWNDNAMWEDIESYLPPKKNNKNLGFFTVAALILLIISGYMIIKNQNHSIHSTTNSNKTILSENNSATNTLSNQNKLAKNINNETIKSTTSINNLNDIKHIKPINKKYNSPKIKSTNTDVFTAYTKNNTSNIFRLIQNKHNSSYLKLTETNSKIYLSNNNSSYENIAKLTKIYQKFPELISTIRNIKINLPDIEIDNNISKIINQPKYSIDLDVGMFYTTRFLTSTGNQNWINRKIQSETILESTNTSISFHKYYRNNLSVEIGLTYTQMVEMFIHRDSTVSITKVYSDTAYIYPNGLYSGGMVNKTTTVYRTIKSPNRFRYLSIPIGINYNFKLNNNIIQIGCGVNIDFWSKYKGYSLGLNGKTIQSTDKLNELYKRPLGISSGFFNANYRFTINSTISGKIGFVSTIDIRSSNVNKSISQKYKQYGALLGLSYRFK